MRLQAEGPPHATDRALTAPKFLGQGACAPLRRIPRPRSAGEETAGATSPPIRSQHPASQKASYLQATGDAHDLPLMMHRTSES